MYFIKILKNRSAQSIVEYLMLFIIFVIAAWLLSPFYANIRDFFNSFFDTMVGRMH